MKKYKTITTALILVLAVFGCEREDLHYGDSDNPDTPPAPTTDSIYEEPYTPKEDVEAIAFATRVNGTWHGSLYSTYVNDYGITVSGTYDTEMTFSQYEAKSVNGNGREADYKDGKRQWLMSFTWFVESTGKGGLRLMMKRVDGYELASSVCRFDGDTLKMELVGSDGLETCRYVLTSSK